MQLKQQSSKQEIASVTLSGPSNRPQIRVVPLENLNLLSLDEIVTMTIYLQLLRLWEEAKGGLLINQVERREAVDETKPPSLNELPETIASLALPPMDNASVGIRNPQTRKAGAVAHRRKVPPVEPIQFDGWTADDLISPEESYSNWAYYGSGGAVTGSCC